MAVLEMMKRYGISWETIRSDFAISGRRAKLMVPSIKQYVTDSVQNDGNRWTWVFLSLLYGYRPESTND